MDTRKIRSRYRELTSKIIDSNSVEKTRIESEIIGLIALNKEYAISYFSTIIQRTLRIKSRKAKIKFDSYFVDIVVFDDKTLGLAFSSLNKTSVNEEEYANVWLNLIQDIVKSRNLFGVIRYIAVNGYN